MCTCLRSIGLVAVVILGVSLAGCWAKKANRSWGNATVNSRTVKFSVDGSGGVVSQGVSSGSYLATVTFREGKVVVEKATVLFNDKEVAQLPEDTKVVEVDYTSGTLLPPMEARFTMPNSASNYLQSMWKSVQLRALILASLAVVFPTGRWLAGQEDVADIVSQDLRVGKDEHKRYFLIEPNKGAKAPKKGYGLLVVLPGGAGGADFHPFIKRIYKNALPEGYLLAQPVAVKWTDEQQIVWPTEKNRVEGMKFSTEEFVEAVIQDLTDKHKVDPERIFTLSWSSSGPAAYAISLSSKKVTGSFIAMSVFKPNLLPPLEKAKGRAYFLYHSPDDRVCPFRMAEQAAEDLKKSGATVKLMTYEGGHGWRGNLYDDIREGMEWLDKNHATRGKP
jgi:predicted esterase